MFAGIEDQIATAITGAITFAAGWLLDNKVPRKVAKWAIGLIWKPKPNSPIPKKEAKKAK